MAWKKTYGKKTYGRKPYKKYPKKNYAKKKYLNKKKKYQKRDFTRINRYMMTNVTYVKLRANGNVNLVTSATSSIFTYDA